jgi:hypothetical protein
MEPEEIYSSLQQNLGFAALSEHEWLSIRTSLTTALAFAAFLDQIGRLTELTPDAEHVAARIAQSLHRLYGVRDITDEIATVASSDIEQDARYTNESTISRIDSFLLMRKIAADVASDARPIPLQWRTYANVAELQAEVREHVAVLQAPDETVRAKVLAILHMSRLQIIFLGNTLC